MTFEELETLRQEDWLDVDGSPCPLPSPASIATAREIHAAVLALGPVPERAELEVDGDKTGGCAVMLWSAGPSACVWFHAHQDGAITVIVTPREVGRGVRNGAPLAEQVREARRFVGWDAAFTIIAASA